MTTVGSLRTKLVRIPDDNGILHTGNMLPPTGSTAICLDRGLLNALRLLSR